MQKDKIEASKEAAIEAEHKAAQVRAQLPLEQRILQFKELLIEKEVSAFSIWEKELQKIVFDPRYLLLTSKERKQVFDKYVKDRANEESKEKAAVLKRKKEEFRLLLKEANVSLKNVVSFGDFTARYSRDERYKAIEKLKDRESLFNDYMSDLRKQEKEDKYAEKEKMKKNFVSMLKELKSLHRHSSWSETKKLLENDPRFKAIESSSRREDYFRDHCKQLDEKSGHNGDSSKGHKENRDKHKDKDKEKSDKEESKNKSTESKMDHDGDEVKEKEPKIDDKQEDGEEEEREEGDDAPDDEDQKEEEKRKEKEKQERVEASLRERSKEVKEQLSKYQNEREKERDQLKRDEAFESFKALLIDLIKPGVASGADSKQTSSSDLKESKSVELSWKEAKKILKRDSRWSYCKILEKEKKEQLFEEHMSRFRAKKRDLFHQLLDDTSGVALNSTWKEVKKLIKSDSRYEKLQQSESFKLEKEFENYINEKYQKAKQDFKELLMQTKLITYKSFGMIKESPQHLKEIEDLLSKDKSYLVLECASEERKKLLLEYVEQLSNEGPPPPPTATEPVRRK